ncbi:MAG: tRNA (cytidine(34)-2'-O)-methyltransferase [Pseudanabaenaceae cyanobacterium bins.68]|nr:tRNA (cytidine(34)-2'-O)-methyltransferase [Pseudanabaenaceae cyanobacterium bins.68]
MLQVALIYPQIPPNTGNIARTCAATHTPLHLVEPLGFQLSDRYLKRAGLDYWEFVRLIVHPDLGHLRQAAGDARWVCFDTTGAENFYDFQFQANDWLLFGSEPDGLPPELLQGEYATVYIPMPETRVRSLNLSVSAALGLFEARRQLGLT